MYTLKANYWLNWSIFIVNVIYVVSCFFLVDSIRDLILWVILFLVLCVIEIFIFTWDNARRHRNVIRGFSKEIE